MLKIYNFSINGGYIMSTSAENLSRIGSVAGLALNEGSSFPIKNLKGVGLDISNNDGLVDLIFRISINGTQGITQDYRVPAGGVLNELFLPFDELDILQASSAFDIIVRNPITV